MIIYSGHKLCVNLVAHSLLMCVSRSPFQCEGNWIRCLLRHPIPRNRDHHFLKDVQSYPSDLCLSKRLGSPFLVPQYNPAYPCMVVLKAKIERSYKSISFKVPKSSYIHYPKCRSVLQWVQNVQMPCR